MSVSLYIMTYHMPKVISIEGNIGAGKTTILRRIEELNLPGVFVLKEPVDEWAEVKDSSGKNILEHYYSDPKKYAFAFQAVAFNTRMTNLKKAFASGNCIIVCERSLQSDANIFAKMLFEDGTMDEISYRAYQSLYRDGVQPYSLDMVIYLDVPPETCKERIQTRARSGEESIGLDYLKMCDKYHRDWLESTGLEYPVIKYTTFNDVLKVLM
jgi:deoxyadenosine/deoxycytidine kinase